MNLSSRITLIFVIFVNVVLAQKKDYPYLSMNGKDTTIVFHIEQGRDLIRKNEQRKECIELMGILNKESIQKDTIINSQKKKVSNLEGAIKEKDIIIAKKEESLSICANEKKSLSDELRTEKTKKWFAVVGMVVIGVLGIVY